MDNGSLATGLLLIMLGTFLISRTVNKDATGRTLPDRLLGNHGGAAAPTADTPTSPRTTGRTPATSAGGHRSYTGGPGH